MITYADLTGGMYYPMGGIYSIIEDMIRIAAETGVQIRTEAAVEEILIENGRAVGVRLASGEQLRADVIVSNADLPYTYRSLIPSRHRKAYPDSRLERMRYSCSGYILFLGLDKTYPNMRHQALYFSGDYRASLDAIFRAGALPEEPSFHLNNPTITDPGLAPPGHSLLYVLAPMPTLRPHNKAHDIEGLYFVGQGTYPGIGTPMVLISARLLAERLTQA